MLKGTQLVCFIVLLLCVAGCSGEEARTGGNCGYTHNPGTCTGTADNTFTFEGIIDGETVVNTGNGLGYVVDLEEGESIPCYFLWAVSGSCTPCMFDIGPCGEEAWDQYRTSQGWAKITSATNPPISADPLSDG